MASGFIILKDGRCFARRWTIYDKILHIVSNELDAMSNDEALADWLRLQIADESDDEAQDAGWGFFKKSTDQWTIRNLDVRSLTKENQSLFVAAVVHGFEQAKKQTEQYNEIFLSHFQDLYQMCLLAEKGAPPLELTDWNELAEACTEQNGPGWE